MKLLTRERAKHNDCHRRCGYQRHIVAVQSLAVACYSSHLCQYSGILSDNLLFERCKTRSEPFNHTTQNNTDSSAFNLDQNAILFWKSRQGLEPLVFQMGGREEGRRGVCVCVCVGGGYNDGSVRQQPSRCKPSPNNKML